MKRKADRNCSVDKRIIEREIREQIRKDAEIPEEVYESARKAYQMILDGEVQQEHKEKNREDLRQHTKDSRRLENAGRFQQEYAENSGRFVQEHAENSRRFVQKHAENSRRFVQEYAENSGRFRQEHAGKQGAVSTLLYAAPRFAWGMAAVLAVCVIFNAVFPAQVRALPVVGSIFAQIQDELGYENMSEYAWKLEETDGSTDSDAQGDGNADVKDKKDADTNGEGNEDANVYTKTSGGLTVSCSEIYADTKTIYLSMKLKSDEPFPKSFYYTKGREMEKMEGVIPMILHGGYQYSFMEETDPEMKYFFEGDHLVEGLMVNENTFEFLWRINLSANRTLYQNQSNIGKGEALPENFTLQLDIDQINSLISMEKIYQGPWSFRIPVTIDDSHIETVEIHEVGATGAGLVSVEKTPFEITTHALTPGMVDYKVVVLDAKGNKLPVIDGDPPYAEAEEIMHDKWKIQDYDVSSIEVFVLGNAFYENIYSKGIWSELDWEGNEKKAEEEKLGTLLRQYAEYSKVISFE